MIYENRLTLLCKKRSEEHPDKRMQLTEEIIRLMPAMKGQKKKHL